MLEYTVLNSVNLCLPTWAFESLKEKMACAGFELVSSL